MLYGSSAVGTVEINDCVALLYDRISHLAMIDTAGVIPAPVHTSTTAANQSDQTGWKRRNVRGHGRGRVNRISHN